MKRDVALKVVGIKKSFRLPHDNINSFKGVLVNPLRYYRSRHSYELKQVLSRVDFTVNKGEFFGILGRNGSGKSTLFKIIAGIYAADHGSVEYKGTLYPFIELGVGFNGELTGRENVYLSGSLFGLTDKQISEKYDDIVSFAELEEYMDLKLKNYSSGMHVRLAFSVVTILSYGDVLLLDEVLAVGDEAFQQKCFEYFKNLKKQKKTVLFVTHNMPAVKKFCDRAVLIERGKVHAIGDAKKIADEYTKLLKEASD